MTLRGVSAILKGGAKGAAFVGELSLQRTFAAIVIGDNWIAAVKVHVDVLGAVYPFCWHYEFLETIPGATPSINAIRKGLRRCWGHLVDSDNPSFSKMFVCLPGWGCRTKAVKDRILLGGDGDSDGTATVVTAREVQDLIDKTVADHGERGFVATECIPRYFIVENGRKTPDPVGELCTSLGMEGHMVLADRNIVETIEGTLADLDVDIDVMRSPCTVMRGNLSAEERDGSMLFVDVDRFKTYCGFFAGGEFVRMTHVDVGSRSILEGAAEALGLLPGELADWVNEWEDLVQLGRWNPEDQAPVMPHSANGPESWEALDEAAAEPARELFGHIYEHLKFVNAREHIHISRVVFTGDDYLTLRALKKAGEAYLGIACTRLVPDRLHNAERIQIPGLARMVGLVRQEENTIRGAQPYLAEKARTWLDRFNDWFRSGGAGLAKRVGSFFAGVFKGMVRASLAAGTRLWRWLRKLAKWIQTRRNRQSRRPPPGPSLQVFIR